MDAVKQHNWTTCPTVSVALLHVNLPMVWLCMLANNHALRHVVNVSTSPCIQVKVNWRHGVVDNEQLNRELLDTPPDKLKKALTPGQQT